MLRELYRLFAMPGPNSTLSLVLSLTLFNYGSGVMQEEAKAMNTVSDPNEIDSTKVSVHLTLYLTLSDANSVMHCCPGSVPLMQCQLNLQ